MPDRFLRRECARLGIALPAAGEYGCGLVFLPRETAQRHRVQALLHSIVEHEGQRLLGWRDVPTDDALLGETARSVEPVIKQVFVGRGPDVRDRRALRAEALRHPEALREGRRGGRRARADVRLPAEPLVQHAHLQGHAERRPDRVDVPGRDRPDVESALALVHQRFSTNTFPSWPLAHPYRYVAHNGEINTLRGNINWMRAREALCRSSVFGDELWKVLPVTRDGLSDSATFDNVLEFLVMSGRSLPHAILMMIPEPWQKHESMSPERRAFYEYHSALMEPWDGPASIAFTDGTVIGAILDRNGLRPSRYYVTKDGLVVMASEVGVLDIPPEDVLIKERLHPGRIFLVDTAQGRIVDDAEIKAELAAEHPYADWLRDNLVQLGDLPKHKAPVVRSRHGAPAADRLRVHARGPPDPAGADGEQGRGGARLDGHRHGARRPVEPAAAALRLLQAALRPGHQPSPGPDPGGARDVDGVHDRPRGQPPRAAAGVLPPDRDPRPRAVERGGRPDPPHASIPWFKATTLPMLYPVAEGAEGLARALEGLQAQASQAIADGHNVLILSDRGISREQAAIPSLLATAAVHHHLTRRGERTRVGLVLETGDAREVHHMCLLIGYGAGAVNPWVAFETLDDMIRQGLLPGIDHRARREELHQGAQQGDPQGHGQDGDLDAPELLRRPDLRGHRPRQERRRPLLHGHALPRQRDRPRRHRGGGAPAARARVPRPAGRARGARLGRRVPVAPRRGVPPVQPRDGVQAPARDAERPVPDLQGVHPRRGRPEPEPGHAPRALRAPARRDAGAARRGGAGRVDPPALRHGRHVLRLDQPGGPRDARHRDEPDRRQVEHRRGRRGLRALPPRGQRRLAAERDQAGGLRALRRDQRVPRQLRRPPDQDGPGRQARRGRPAPGPQGLPVDRQGAPLDARRGADLPAAASRHLLDRGPEAAHPRPEEREPAGAHPREARRRGRRRHGGGGRGQGLLGRGPDLGPRRRHGRLAAHVDQARRRPVGARPRRDPAGARPQQAARPHRRPGGRPAEDGARRGHRRAARRRGVRLLHRAAGRHGLRHDARLPPQHVPGGHRDPGPRAAQALRGRARSSSRPSSGSSPRRSASSWPSSASGPWTR